MRMKKGLVEGFIIVLLVISLLPVTSAEDTGLQVIVLREEKNYVEGDVIDLTIHILFEENYVDPDTIDITIGSESNDIHPVAGKEKTGIYKASYIIDLEDLSEETRNGDSDPWTTLDVEVEVDYGDFHTWVDADIQLELLWVFTSMNDPLPDKGDEVIFTSTVFYNGDFHDPETIEMDLLIDDADHEDAIELEPVKISTGIYEAKYSITSEDDHSHFYEVETTVLDEEKMAWSEIEFSLRYYQIWINEHENTDGTNRSSDDVVFDLFIAELNGAMVSKASVWIEYWMSGSWTGVESGTVQGTADDNGKVTFTLPVPEGVLENVMIEGWANFTYKQHFQGYFDYEGEEEDTIEPRENGFDVFLKEDNMYPTESEITVDLIAYHDGEPLVQDVFVYASTNSEVLFHGKRSVDNGSFSVTITTPSLEGGETTSRIRLDILANISGTYHDDLVRIYAWETEKSHQSNLDITIKELNIGGLTKVEVKGDLDVSSRGIPYGFMMLVPASTGEEKGKERDDIPEWLEMAEGSWKLWGESRTIQSVFLLTEVGPNRYVGYIHAPDSWSDIKEFYIGVYLIQEIGRIAHMTYDYVILEAGEGTEKEDDNGFIPGFTFSGLFVGLSFGLMVVGDWRRRRNGMV